MGIQKIITSDITGKKIKESELIYLYKEFGYPSDFDSGILSVCTTENELINLFGNNNVEKNKVGICFACRKNIIEYIINNINYSFTNDLEGFKELLDERSLNIEEMHIDLCNDCLKKYFGKFVKFR